MRLDEWGIAKVDPVVVNLDIGIGQLPHALRSQGAYLVGSVHAVHTLVASLGLWNGRERGRRTKRVKG